MYVFTIEPTRVRQTILGALGGGVIGGALVPLVIDAAGAAPARAALAAAIAGTTIAARRGQGLVARIAIAAGSGLAAGALEGVGPRGAGVAVLGLGVGLAVAPEGLLGGARSAFLRALAPAAGAIALAVLSGYLAKIEPFLSMGPVPWGVVLGAALGLGIGLGEVLRTLRVEDESVPKELELARTRLSPDLRPLADSARTSFVRVIDSLHAVSDMTINDRLETLTTARELAIATARNAIAADELSRTLRSLGRDPSDPAATATSGTRERVESGLARRKEQARTEAANAAAGLSELSFALAERTAPLATVVPEPTDIADRARGLAARLGTGEGKQQAVPLN